MNFNTISNLMDIYQIFCIKIDSLNDKKGGLTVKS